MILMSSFRSILTMRILPYHDTFNIISVQWYDSEDVGTKTAQQKAILDQFIMSAIRICVTAFCWAFGSYNRGIIRARDNFLM